MRPRRVHTPLLALALALALAACEDEPTGPEPVSVEETEFAPDLAIDLGQMTRLEDGVYIQDLVVGDGEQAVAGDTITVHYELWLHDGTPVHSSRDHGDGAPGEFALVWGPGGLLRGWVDGIPGMRVGGMRKLVIPWQRGFGESTVQDAQGTVVIPAYSNLVFEVELLETVHVDPDAQP